MANLKELSALPERLAGGHRLCGGCGASICVRQVLMGAGDADVVCSSATGCLEVSTTVYPYSSWKTPFIHNAFANSAATMSGVEAAYNGLKRAGKIPADKEIKFCAFGGDGFNDIARELETADGLVLAAPVYWYTFPAQIKHVIDRFVSLYNAKKFPAGIPAALITCCAEPAMDTFDGIVFAYRKTVSLLGCRNVGEVLIPGVYGAGEISQTDGLAQARALADKLCPTV